MTDAFEDDSDRKVLGERKFHVKGLGQRIVLHIYEPRCDHGIWICEYQMSVPEFPQQILVPVAGADKLESVTAAIRRIRSDLRLIEDRLGREVTFLREPRLDLI